MSQIEAPAEPGLDRRQRTRIISSTFIGTITEWFDFYIYAMAAALFFPAIFFQNMSPTVATLSAFGTLAGGFLARPIGGIIGGHFGDRYGRKKVLIVSMTVMGLATATVGLLPSYDTIGVWAPVLLVLARVAQGLGAGAEWGGAMLMIVESFNSRRRGLWGAVAVMGVSGGGVLATLVFAVITRFPEDQQQWIWRVPFIASIALIGIGLWIRLGVTETPAFRAARAEAPSRQRSTLPIMEVFRTQRRNVLIAVALGTSHTVAYQIFVTFTNGYARLVDVPVDRLLDYQLVMGVIGFVMVPTFGALSDRFGRRPLVVLGCVWIVPCLVVLYNAMQSGNLTLIFTALCLAMVGHSMIYGPFSAMLAELFTTRTRFTGASLGYQIGGAISGLAPMLATAMLAGDPARVHYVPLMVVVTGALGIVAALLTREGAGKPLPA